MDDGQGTSAPSPTTAFAPNPTGQNRGDRKSPGCSAMQLRRPQVDDCDRAGFTEPPAPGQGEGPTEHTEDQGRGRLRNRADRARRRRIETDFRPRGVHDRIDEIRVDPDVDRVSI